MYRMPSTYNDAMATLLQLSSRYERVLPRRNGGPAYRTELDAHRASVATKHVATWNEHGVPRPRHADFA